MRALVDDAEPRVAGVRGVEVRQVGRRFGHVRGRVVVDATDAREVVVHAEEREGLEVGGRRREPVVPQRVGLAQQAGRLGERPHLGLGRGLGDRLGLGGCRERRLGHVAVPRAGHRLGDDAAPVVSNTKRSSGAGSSNALAAAPSAPRLPGGHLLQVAMGVEQGHVVTRGRGGCPQASRGQDLFGGSRR